MAVKSVYMPQPAIEGDRVSIAGDEHRHLLVARAEPGEAIEIFDGAGAVWSAEVVALSRRETVARILSSRRESPDPVELILVMASIKPPAFDLALQKVVEVGVARIVPFAAARSNVSGGKHPDRWARIVVEAAKQSKRYFLPRIEKPSSFAQALQIEAATRILFAERGGGSLRGALAPGSPAAYLVGPEGGWTGAELEAAREKGWTPVTLGTGILKSETAAIVGGALIRYELQSTV